MANTAQAQLIEPIDDLDTLKRHLAGLVEADPRLARVVTAAGEVPLRRREGGFAGLVAIVVSQLLSVQSANAIHARLVDILGEVTPERYLALPEDRVRKAGLSGSKYRTLVGIAEAELSGSLDYAMLLSCSEEAAIAHLMALKGIGRWTAEIYLLFCLGHPDIFPAGDLALRKMVGVTHGLNEMPSERDVRALTQPWAPYRGAAARLLWRYFAVLRQKEGIGV